MNETQTRQSERLPQITFSRKQSRLIANALSLLAFSVFSVIVGFSLFYTLRFVSAHSSVLLPPIVAIILAKVVQPAYDHLRRFFWRLIGHKGFRLRSHRRFRSTTTDTRREQFARVAANILAIAVLAAAFFIPLILFLWYFGQLLITQTIALINAIPSIATWIADFTRKHSPHVFTFVEAHNLQPALERLDPANWFDPAAITANLGGSAVSIWGGLRNWMASLLGWVALPVYTAIYLASRPLEGADVSRLLIGVSEKNRNTVKFLIDEFIRIVVAFFRGQVMVALIQGILFGLGFQLVARLNYGMAIGLLLGVFNIVPYLGNLTGMPVIGALALFGQGGGAGRLGLVLLVFAAVQMIDGYLITPRVMRNRTGLNAFVVIFSLFFWNAVIGGALGMVLAIPLSAFIVVFWRLLVRDYFQNPEADPDPAPTPSGEPGVDG